MHIFDILTGKDEHPALLTPDELTLTYQQLRTNVYSLFAQLHIFGLGKGDRIAIAMTNGSSMACIFLAASLCGTAAPLNPKYKQEEFAFYYQDLQAKALITLPGTPEAAITAINPDMLLIQAITNADGTLSLELSREIIQPQRETSIPDLPQADDVAMILHTSGTTSRPKRVPIRHRNLIASAHNIIGVYSLTPNDTNLCLMPLFHIHGLVGCLLATLASGGTFICPTGFNALEFWKLVERYKPTWYSAAPTIHQMILARANRNEDIVKSHSFRFIRSSSAPLPPVIIEQMETVLNTPVVESYSMTEAAHQMTSNPLPPKIRKPGSVGYGHGVEIGIMDEDGNLLSQGSLGEVVVKGANVIDGYENNPQANATAFVNGWFRTGDQGKLDPDGYLYLTGRIKELINRGGEKISPLEIDDLLLRHPAVAEALAFAVSHKTLGEEIHAAVVLKSNTSEQELKSYCSQHLAEFKVPKQIHLLEALPRGATGKLQRLNMSKFLKLETDK
ncbi:acyl--CoA ligase [Nodularia sp. NIES-3585]|uniref:acyl--CoA ligase n=1 Tax=Nodularia sp. NIES-3585 TaxID=1973477 RepID=UPI000B5CBAE6|nr:acyl--CoA ligase [Nodularia sp. NIES-3585]GAX34390.1 AMP-dependent synthetase and ligase [Nodularia sp. NIES-3585]